MNSTKPYWTNNRMQRKCSTRLLLTRTIDYAKWIHYLHRCEFVWCVCVNWNPAVRLGIFIIPFSLRRSQLVRYLHSNVVQMAIICWTCGWIIGWFRWSSFDREPCRVVEFQQNGISLIVFVGSSRIIKKLSYEQNFFRIPNISVINISIGSNSWFGNILKYTFSSSLYVLRSRNNPSQIPTHRNE